MNKKLQILVVIILLLIGIFNGCIEITSRHGEVNRENNGQTSTTDEKKFVGIWKSETSGILSTYYSNGTYMAEGKSYYWRLEGEHLIISSMIGGYDSIYSYSFSNDNQTLTLTNIKNQNIVVYTKQ